MFRNRVAHHAPLWDQDLTAHYERLNELLGWLNPALARAEAHCSTVGRIVADGHTKWRRLGGSLVDLG